jgi:hypothetical protein
MYDLSRRDIGCTGDGSDGSPSDRESVDADTAVCGGSDEDDDGHNDDRDVDDDGDDGENAAQAAVEMSAKQLREMLVSLGRACAGELTTLERLKWTQVMETVQASLSAGDWGQRN